ncbi:flagellar export protein FliJ [bacterium]|nr:flagellar export protein FliJ [bacterium]
MAKFKFNLQRVLDIRATQEKLRQNELAVERKRESDILRRIEYLRREQTDAYRRGGAILTEHLSDIRWFVAQQRYLEAIERTIARTHANLDAQRQAVETSRLALVEAARKRKLLEKLKDKRMEIFKKEEETAEQKIIDEIGGRACGLPAARPEDGR